MTTQWKVRLCKYWTARLVDCPFNRIGTNKKLVGCRASGLWVRSHSLVFQSLAPSSFIHCRQQLSSLLLRKKFSKAIDNPLLSYYVHESLMCSRLVFRSRSRYYRGKDNLLFKGRRSADIDLEGRCLQNPTATVLSMRGTITHIKILAESQTIKH